MVNGSPLWGVTTLYVPEADNGKLTMESEVFDLSGRKIENGKSPKGINIIRYSDGTTKKVLMK